MAQPVTISFESCMGSTQIDISIGLEDPKTIVEDFLQASK